MKLYELIDKLIEFCENDNNAVEAEVVVETDMGVEKLYYVDHLLPENIVRLLGE